jgi:soluble lytic murein transglycosylase-like protein
MALRAAIGRTEVEVLVRIWRNGAIAALLGGLLLAAAAAPPARAQIYTFVDSRGVTHFSNVPNDPRYVAIPRRERYSEPSTRVPRYIGYDGLILLTALEHDVPPGLVKAVIAAESLFNPDAVSRKGAQGLMQLMPTTASKLGVADPFAADQNVNGGVRYLREMLDRYGDMQRALAAYNAGPTAVDRYRGVPPYPETQAYVQRVMTYYRQYNDDFGR